MSDRPLWTVEAMAQRCARRAPARCRASIPGISIDTRTIAPGEAFFAIKGDNRDGHDFVAAALAAGAGARGGRRRQARRASRRTRRCSSSPTCSTACAISRARRARARRRKIVGVTGSVGKTGTKEALRLALVAARRDPRLGRLLQQPLGRAAVARALPAERALRRVRDRHEPCRRDRAARRGWCARTSRSSPRSSRCISNSSARSRRSPTPRPKSSSGSSRAARR